jgi:hypothetical protein
MGNIQSDDCGFAGGLIGAFHLGMVEHCFAGGTVTAYKASGDVYAGGLIGQFKQETGSLMFTLKKCAAIGVGVTAIGSGPTQNVGRVAGKVPSSGIVQDNYALNTMRVEKDAWENRYTPAIDTTVASNANTSSGKDISASALKSQSFWSAEAELGFPSTDWDFSKVVIDGHPVFWL